MESWVMLLVFVIGTVGAAWAGFFMTLSLRGRIAALERAVAVQTAATRSAPPAAPLASPPAPRETPPPEPEPQEPEPQEPAQQGIAPAANDGGEPAFQGLPPTDEDAAPEAPAPPRPAQSAPPRAAQDNPFRRLEQSLGGNWLVWVAGAALALGGLFMVRFAFEQGWFGPLARVLAGALAGAAMLAASEVLRRRPAPGGAPGRPPAVLAAAGLITLYGDAFAAYAAFGLIPGPAAFALLAAISAFALFLAWLHGPVIAAFGLGGAYAAPVLIGSDDPSLAMLLIYVFAVTAGSLAMARFARWRWTVWLSLAGGAGWPALWLAAGFDPAQALALAIYLPALAAIAIAFAWDEAGAPPEPERLWRLQVQRAPTSVLAAYACMAAVCGLTLWLLAEWSYRPSGFVSLFAISALALGAAWRREAFAFFPVLALAIAAGAIWLWPDWLAAQSLVRAAARAASTDAGQTLTRVFATATAFIALFGAGGWLAQGRLSLRGPMATASAAAPVVILAILAVKLGPLAPDWLWSTALIVIAVLEAGLVEMLSHNARRDGRAGPVAAYALGACAGALIALALLLNHAWLGAAIAAEAAVAALLWRRWNAQILVWTAVGLALLALWQLTLGARYLFYWRGAGALAGVGLVLAYAAAAAGLEAGGRILRAGGRLREGAAVRTLEGGAAVLGVTGAFIALRLTLNGGALRAPYDSLPEIGLQTAFWLAVPLALRLRFAGDLTVVQRWAERILIALAGLHVLLIQLLFANPWAGVNPSPVTGPPVFNALLPAYGLPAILTAALAVTWRRRGLPAAPFAAFAATLAVFVWITLETRRAFHAPDLSGWSVSDAEGWAYSAVWLVTAALAMAVGVVRRAAVVRYAALTAITATTLKVFLVDLAGLDGVWRALSFLGLGAVLMAIAVIYQRVILPAERAMAASEEDEAPAS